jgi:hypothetical protein
VHDDERYLIVINLSDYPVQAQVQVPWADASGGKRHLIDVLSGGTYGRVEVKWGRPASTWNWHPGTISSSSVIGVNY